MKYTVKHPVLSEIDRKDTLSFLGYRNYPANKPDMKITELLDKSEELLLNSIQPRYIYGISEYASLSNLLIGNDINTHIFGCERVALMCVTLGLEADRIIAKTGINDITGSLILDALSGAAVEQICNLCEEDIKLSLPDKKLTTRYSPGYGDFPINIQSDFLDRLDANKKIGLFVSENDILIPRKSVTAVIGIKNQV